MSYPIGQSQRCVASVEDANHIGEDEPCHYPKVYL